MKIKRYKRKLHIVGTRDEYVFKFTIAKPNDVIVFKNSVPHIVKFVHYNMNTKQTLYYLHNGKVYRVSEDTIVENDIKQLFSYKDHILKQVY